MLRMAICCGGGFSSSTMAAHLNKQIKEKGLEDELFLEFIPFQGIAVPIENKKMAAVVRVIVFDVFTVLSGIQGKNLVVQGL